MEFCEQSQSKKMIFVNEVNSALTKQVISWIKSTQIKLASRQDDGGLTNHPGLLARFHFFLHALSDFTLTLFAKLQFFFTTFQLNSQIGNLKKIYFIFFSLLMTILFSCSFQDTVWPQFVNCSRYRIIIWQNWWSTVLFLWPLILVVTIPDNKSLDTQ